MIPPALLALLWSFTAPSSALAVGDLYKLRGVSGREIRFRPGTEADVRPIQVTMLSMKMNPLGIQHERFIVAEDASSGSRVGFGQIRPFGSPRTASSGRNGFELASVWVDPEWRRGGVASELVQRLLSLHGTTGTRATDVHLLTLATTSSFYERLGFAVVDRSSVPATMQLEFAAGSVITRALNEQLVCMRYVAPPAPSQ